MNFKALSPEHFYYFKNVLGVESAFLDQKEQPVNHHYKALVVIDEELNPKKNELLNKILKAFHFEKAEIVQKKDLPINSKAYEVLFFGRHLENHSLQSQSKLVGPSLQDLIDEPSLKKLLWLEMKDYMKEKRQ